MSEASTVRLSLAVALAALVGVAATAAAPQGRLGPGEPPRVTLLAPPVADHHLHIRSAAGAAIHDALAVSDGTPSEPADPSSPVDASDVIEALDAADVHRGLVLSTAYMFGTPRIQVEDEYAKVRAENDYVAAEVARYPDRLVGACSLNPLADYAFDEIERCGEDPRLSGLKLHLTNSGVDLRDPEHVERLARVFEQSNRLRMPVIVHLRTGNSAYGETDARIFIDEVLSRAPGLPVQIAHMAGWGGYDDATDAALGAFAQAFADGRLSRELYTFDLGAVVFQPAAAGADTALARRTAEANVHLVDRIRDIGVDRVVYATDWPSWPPVAEVRTGIERNIRLIEAALPLTAEERARLFENGGPVFSGRR